MDIERLLSNPDFFSGTAVISTSIILKLVPPRSSATYDPDSLICITLLIEFKIVLANSFFGKKKI